LVRAAPSDCEPAEHNRRQKGFTNPKMHKWNLRQLVGELPYGFASSRPRDEKRLSAHEEGSL
jgi:hypothetical protein